MKMHNPVGAPSIAKSVADACLARNPALDGARRFGQPLQAGSQRLQGAAPHRVANARLKPIV